MKRLIQLFCLLALLFPEQCAQAQSPRVPPLPDPTLPGFTGRPSREVDTFQYMVLLRHLDGGIHYVDTDSLFFQYNGEYAVGNLHYRMKNDFHEVVAEDSLTPEILLPKKEYYADNRFIIDLSCEGLALDSGFYLLEVFNEKNERWLLKFYKSGYPDCPDEEKKKFFIPPPNFAVVISTIISVFVPQLVEIVPPRRE